MSAPQQRIVVALGGNAITRPGGAGDIDAQFAQTAESTAYLADLIDAGHQLIITHGNGPQVGATFRRAELAANEIYPLPLATCVASTQGGMGYMIACCLQNHLAVRGAPRTVTAIVTTVVVDSNDPGFSNPTKPIGPYYDNVEAKAKARDGFVLRPVSGGKFRRVVASPRPLRILENDAIRQLIDSGHVIIACGGGGIPVVDRAGVGYEGVPAVVDKDLASALLATNMSAARLIILTATERVCLNFEKPDQLDLEHMTLLEARKHLADGQFPAGSMGPKIEAAIQFLETSREPDPEVLITTPERVMDALAGNSGTRIVAG